MLRRRILRATIIVIVSVVIGWAALELGQRIDWESVGQAVSRLAWWQVGVLIVLLVVRQIINATPVSRFVRGLSRPRAVLNDLAANLVGHLTPPPGDVVIRIAMFRSWRVDPVDGMAGVTLTSFVFYGARLLSPVLGLMLLAFVGIDRRQWIVATVSGVLALALLTGLVLVVRSQGWAMLLGRWAARVARAVRRDVNEEAWVRAVVSFRERVEGTLKEHLLPALAALGAGIVLEGLILFASLRFVGVSPGDLSAAEILGGFFMVYPLTMLPMFGLGVLDAVLISGWITATGEQLESTLLAGVIVWRAVTFGGALLLGALAVGWWRLALRRNPSPPAETDPPSSDADGQTS
ncbi:lysylphosphatidylglycerol synthase domain-containing protein [Demequina zhanjiangensis]|uniref:Lysylphosphatidylglycerol synthase domain-containing protein n=1 Tax=Demequina zhanjiangensis TaxID=3051659 RepID=A0ABT8G1J8_9MICO|nr:lysylphosphatidylglycerol synthase domain-containing protein [Demequina sp. SYSU T00b26]MDN4472594.1 lysylphosphatidylglycerol synthase domain-containing protein [Demequina sp. SYSU T00b26]